MRNSHPRVDVRTSCKMSAICEELCRGCGVTTAKKDRRVMCSDASMARNCGEDAASVGEGRSRWLAGEERISYLCRKCYGSLEKYKKLQASLVSNMEKAINARESVTSRKRPRINGSKRWWDTWRKSEATATGPICLWSPFKGQKTTRVSISFTT